MRAEKHLIKKQFVQTINIFLMNKTNKNRKRKINQWQIAGWDTKLINDRKDEGPHTECKKLSSYLIKCAD